MGHGSVVVWICDRCGRTENVNGSVAPAGWRESLVRTIRTEHSVEATDSVVKELCGGCSSQLGRFLEPVDRPEGSTTDVRDVSG